MMRGMGMGRMMREGGPAVEDVKPLRITDRRMLAWFYHELGPYWHWIVAGTVATLGASGAQLLIPRPGKDLIDGVIIGHNYANMPHLLYLLLALLAAQQIFSAVRMNIIHVLGQRFVFNLRRECYSHLQGLSLSYYDDHPTGDIMSRLSNDVTAVEDMVVHGADEVIANTVLAVGVIGMLLYYFSHRPILLAAGLWPVPFFLTGIIIFSRFVRPIYRKIREELGDINNELQESISGIRVVKAFGREDYELERFQRRSWQYYIASVKGIRWLATFFPTLGLLTSAGTVTVWWLGARQMPGGSSLVTSPASPAAQPAGSSTRKSGKPTEGESDPPLHGRRVLAVWFLP